MKNRNEVGVMREIAYDNIQNAADQYIGGLENILSDYPPEYAEYQRAKAELADHDGLVKEIYTMAVTGWYKPGIAYGGKKAEMHGRQIRFCGKDWLIECVEDVLKNMGY